MLFRPVSFEVPDLINLALFHHHVPWCIKFAKVGRHVLDGTDHLAQNWVPGSLSS